MIRTAPSALGITEADASDGCCGRAERPTDNLNIAVGFELIVVGKAEDFSSGTHKTYNEAKTEDRSGAFCYVRQTMRVTVSKFAISTLNLISTISYVESATGTPLAM